MLNRLRRWLLLQRELDAALSTAARLEGELQRAEHRLFTEIDSNRRREGDLINAFLSAQAKQTVGPHRLLADDKRERPVQAETPLEKITESEVDFVAKQFIEAARQSGNPYTADAEIVLREMIRKNPDDYTS